MGTQQALTTKQLEFLTTIYSIEEFAEGKEITTSIDEMLICTFGYTEKEYDELTEVLIQYGYIDDDVKLTIDGKQYITLFTEELQKKIDTPNIVINNQFALVNIKELNVGINTKIEKSGGNPVLSFMSKLLVAVAPAVISSVIK